MAPDPHARGRGRRSLGAEGSPRGPRVPGPDGGGGADPRSGRRTDPAGRRHTGRPRPRRHPLHGPRARLVRGVHAGAHPRGGRGPRGRGPGGRGPCGGVRGAAARAPARVAHRCRALRLLLPHARAHAAGRVRGPGVRRQQRRRRVAADRIREPRCIPAAVRPLRPRPHRCAIGWRCSMRRPTVRYSTQSEVDFVIVGSGAAGGVLARELAEAGFSVVVLEQGRYHQQSEFRHDELASWFTGELLGSPQDHPQTFRRTEQQEARVRRDGLPPLLFARCVGGSTVLFTGNYWRFHEVDFNERSRLGPIAGTGFADWPITYAELEPYYTKVEWEVGVSGAPGPFDPPRSRPYPLPPLPVKSSGVLLEQGA